MKLMVFLLVLMGISWDWLETSGVLKGKAPLSSFSTNLIESLLEKRKVMLVIRIDDFDF